MCEDSLLLVTLIKFDSETPVASLPDIYRNSMNYNYCKTLKLNSKKLLNKNRGQSLTDCYATTPQRLQNIKWPLGGSKNGCWGLERCLPWVLWRSRQCSLIRFFDPSTPMRKGCNGENAGKKGVKKENKDVFSGH